MNRKLKHFLQRQNIIVIGFENFHCAFSISRAVQFPVFADTAFSLHFICSWHNL